MYVLLRSVALRIEALRRARHLSLRHGTGLALSASDTWVSSRKRSRLGLNKFECKTNT